MQRIGRTPAISKKNDFAARTQRRRTFLGELRDALHQIVRERLLYASAFLQLTPDVLMERMHVG